MRTFSKRESRKPKTKTKKDRRPHISIQTPYGDITKREDEKYDFSFAFPSHKSYKNHPIRWTKLEVINLINEWASISWGTESHEHHEIIPLAGYITTIYEKQKGLCAITGLPLFGGPGLCECGVGVDIINRSIGVRRGNIRLTSIPFALSRLHVNHAEWKYDKPIHPYEFTTDKYFNIILYTIMKHIQIRLQNDNPFKFHPVVVKFKRLHPSGSYQTREDNSYITFYFYCSTPQEGKCRTSGYYKFVGSKECTLIDKHAYDTLTSTTHKFCHIELAGDVLKLWCDATHVIGMFDSRFINDSIFVREICLAEPNINLEEAVVTFAEQAYKFTISKHYFNNARQKGLICQQSSAEPPKQARISE